MLTEWRINGALMAQKWRTAGVPRGGLRHCAIPGPFRALGMAKSNGAPADAFRPEAAEWRGNGARMAQIGSAE